MKAVLQTRDLDIGYKGKKIAEALNLSLAAGMVTAIIGCNGAGKSTLIRTLTGSLKPVDGEVMIKERNLQDYTRRQLAHLIALVSTDNHSAGGLRLKELVALGRTPHIGRLGHLDKEDRIIIEEAIDAVGIGHKMDSFVAELSDGERQKGMIARGLVQDTPIIIMDEPFSFLDVAARLELTALMKELAVKSGKAVLYSSHEVTEALKLADRIWAFAGGSVEEGSPSQLIDRGVVDKIFESEKVKFNRENLDFTII